MIRNVAVKSVKSVEKLDTDGKTTFIEILQTNPSSFNEVIKMNRLRVFHKGHARQKQPASIKEMKDELQLFSKFYVANQVREKYMDEFFQHDFQSTD